MIFATAYFRYKQQQLFFNIRLIHETSSVVFGKFKVAVLKSQNNSSENQAVLKI